MLVIVGPTDDVGGTLLKWWQYQLVMLVPVTIDGDGRMKMVVVPIYGVANTV